MTIEELIEELKDFHPELTIRNEEGASLSDIVFDEKETGCIHLLFYSND